MQTEIRTNENIGTVDGDYQNTTLSSFSARNQESFNSSSSSIILIQKHWRKYITRKKNDTARVKELIISFLDKKKTYISDTIDRRIHPKSSMDFKIVYNEFNKWKELQKMDHKNLPCNQNKVKQITQKEQKKQQQWEMNQLDKEIKILRTIEQLKVGYIKHKKNEQKEKNLNKMSRPCYWKSKRSGCSSSLTDTASHEEIIEVITPDIAFNQYLVQLYKNLCNEEINVNDRLQLLQKIKETIQENNNSNQYLSKEIMHLIDQEFDLSTRCGSVTTAALVGLRLRFKNLFYKFLEQHSELILLQQGNNDGINEEQGEVERIMKVHPILKIKPVNLWRHGKRR